MSLSSDTDKTEVIEHKESIADVLHNNLVNNIEQHIKSFDVVRLYNGILTNPDSIIPVEMERGIFTLLQLYMVKCHMHGMMNEYNQIVSFFNLIYQHLTHNRYIALNAIVYCISLDFKAMKRIESAIRNMYV